MFVRVELTVETQQLAVGPNALPKYSTVSVMAHWKPARGSPI